MGISEIMIDDVPADAASACRFTGQKTQGHCTHQRLKGEAPGEQVRP